MEELKKRRAILFAKRSILRKKGADTSEVDAELEEIKQKLQADKPKKDASKKDTPKNTEKVNAINAKNPDCVNKHKEIKDPYAFVEDVINKSGWRSGNFKKLGKECFTISNIVVSNSKHTSEVVVSFTLRYNTARHEVVNNVVWRVPYEKVHLFPNDIRNVHYGIKNTTVFLEKKFNIKKFNELKLEEKGWKIMK